jgi:hypothetical protein
MFQARHDPRRRTGNASYSLQRLDWMISLFGGPRSTGTFDSPPPRTLPCCKRSQPHAVARSASDAGLDDLPHAEPGVPPKSTAENSLTCIVQGATDLASCMHISR